MTSRMDLEFVSSMVKRSIPMPSPAVGGKPGFDPLGFDFDDVDAKDHTLLATHLAALRAGETVDVPLYCFETHRRLASVATVSPAPLIVVEGAHLLCTAQLAALFDLRIYVDTPPDVRFIRRLIRDQIQRGRTADSVIQQYLATVRPAHQFLSLFLQQEFQSLRFQRFLQHFG